MAEKLDLEKILAANPKIDRERLREANELFRRLKEAGVRRKEYGLAPEFGGGRVIVQDGTYADESVIHQTPLDEERTTP